MEKVKIKENVFDLLPMGIKESNKQRELIIASELPYSDIELAFADVTSIQYLSETDEILISYLDGVKLKSISKDFENSTYTIAISTDPVEMKLKEMQAQIDELKSVQ